MGIGFEPRTCLEIITEVFSVDYIDSHLGNKLLLVRWSVTETGFILSTYLFILILVGLTTRDGNYSILYLKD